MSAIIAITIIAGAIVFAIYGYGAGIIHQVGSLAAFIVGLIGARLLGPAMSMMLNGADEFICAAVIFLVLFTAVMIIVRMLKLTVKMVFLGPVDSLLGAPMGVLKWLLLTSMLLNLFLLKNPETKALDSPVTLWTLKFLPMAVGETQAYYDRLKNVTIEEPQLPG